MASVVVASTTSAEHTLPVTERENSLTKSLDVATPLEAIRLLRQADTQMFTGYESHPSLYDRTIVQNIQRSIKCVMKVLKKKTMDVSFLVAQGHQDVLACSLRVI